MARPSTPLEISAPWTQSLRDAFRDPRELAAFLDLEPEALGLSTAATTQFPMLVPRSFAERMQRGDPRDPLLLQVLPDRREEVEAAGFCADPVGEVAGRPATGLLRKYRGRALLVVTGACAVHCRYCFRRHFPYAQARTGLRGLAPRLRELDDDPSISEVILSGGDPLTFSDGAVAELLAEVEQLTHVRRLRLHTRLPIVLPNRVTGELLETIAGCAKTVVTVVHANHPAEIQGECAAALAALARTGRAVLNQSVLLRGVNDNAAVLAELSHRLLDAGVVPYYLHQLDRVAGATHFEVEEAQGRRIMRQLRESASGYAVPRYVRERAGAPAKDVIH